MKFKEYINEALITLGNKRPKYNNIVILAGGGGSGKGFVTSNLLGVEGRIFDVDELKKLALKSYTIRNKIKSEYGIDIKDLNLSNPKHVSDLHMLISKIKLDKRQKELLLKTIDPNNQYKPNLIFDVTLKDMPKFSNLVNMGLNLGYDKKNIHIVWVLTKLSIALTQNFKRERKVQTDIIVQTHKGASMTMGEILTMTKIDTSMFDGDIWIVFNQPGVDTEYIVGDPKTNKIFKSKTGKKPAYLKKANYIKVKEAGKNTRSLGSVKDELKSKIENYPVLTDEDYEAFVELEKKHI